MNLNRRSLITGLVAFAAAAPSIVRAGSLMPVRALVLRLPMPLVNADGGEISFVRCLIQQVEFSDTILLPAGIKARTPYRIVNMSDTEWFLRRE